MKTIWTEQKALSILKGNGAIIKDKLITAPKGFNGLKACSAFDYLVNHCGYRTNL